MLNDWSMDIQFVEFWLEKFAYRSLPKSGSEVIVYSVPVTIENGIMLMLTQKAKSKQHHPFLHTLGWCLCGCHLRYVTYVTSGLLDHLPYTWEGVTWKLKINDKGVTWKIQPKEGETFDEE